MRRRMALLLPLLLLMMTWPAAAGSSAALTLRTTDGAGKPLQGASVEVYEWGQGLVNLATTGADGAVFLPLTHGARQVWMIRVSARGYRVQETGWFAPAHGGVKSLSLEPAFGDLQALIRNDSGEVPEVTIWLLASGGQLMAHKAVSNGRLVMPQLPPGDYQIVVTAKGYGTAATRVTITAGRTASETIRLRPGTFTAQGEVLDGITRKPVEGARVELLNKLNAIAVGSTTSAGRFTLSAPFTDGPYRVRVTAPGYTEAINGDQTVSPGGALDFAGANQLLLYPATGSIEGSLIDELDRPMRVKRLVLLREGFGEVTTTTVGEDGRFRFTGIPAGFRYQVVADEAIDYIRTEWHQLLTSGWIDLKPGITAQVNMTPQSWYYPFSLGRAVLNGKVKLPNGLPLEGATVELLRHTRVMESTTTDETGGFAFTNLTASEQNGIALAPYMLRISKEGFVATREVLVVGESRVTFALPAHSRLMVEATLYPDTTAPRGRVTDHQGRPLTDARVHLWVDGSSEPLEAITETNGWYRFEPIHATLWSATLDVSAAHYESANGVDVTSAAGQGEPLPTVRLTPRRSTLEGLILGLDGKPVGGATVRLWGDGAELAQGTTGPDGFYRVEADLTAIGPVMVTAGREGYAESGARLAEAAGSGERITQTLVLAEERVTIEGRVRDAEGRAVPGADVELLLEGQGVVHRFRSDSFGQYQFTLSLPQGATWSWLRVMPTDGRFAGSFSHGLDYSPQIRLVPGGSVVADLLVRK